MFWRHLSWRFGVRVHILFFTIKDEFASGRWLYNFDITHYYNNLLKIINDEPRPFLPLPV